jgi:hypothetical protein
VEQLLVVGAVPHRHSRRQIMSQVSVDFVKQHVVGALYHHCRRTMSLVMALALDATLVLYLVEIVEQLLVVGAVPHRRSSLLWERCIIVGGQ